MHKDLVCTVVLLCGRNIYEKSTCETTCCAKQVELLCDIVTSRLVRSLQAAEEKRAEKAAAALEAELEAMDDEENDDEDVASITRRMWTCFTVFIAPQFTGEFHTLQQVPESDLGIAFFRSSVANDVVYKTRLLIGTLNQRKIGRIRRWS